MTQQQIRDIVVAYIGLQDTAKFNDTLLAARKVIEAKCQELRHECRNHLWLIPSIGPVLTAGLMAGTQPADCKDLISFWRVCGIVRPRHFNVSGAVRLLKEYGVDESATVVPRGTVEEIANATNRNPEKLPACPDFADMVAWLNRHTYSVYLHQVVMACTLELPRRSDYWESEHERIRQLVLNSDNRPERCKRFMQASYLCTANELRSLLKPKPTDSMLNYVATHEIAKEFTSQYYRRMTTEKKSTDPLDSAGNRV